MSRPVKEVVVIIQVYDNGSIKPEQLIAEELEHLRKYKCISDSRFTQIKGWRIKETI